MLQLSDARYAYAVSSQADGGATAGERRPVLDGASLDVAPGELVCLVGPNGAGKSTLARALCGTVRLDSGSVLLDGKAATLAELHRAVGFVRQDPESQLVAPVVFDEVAFGPCSLGLPEAEIRSRVTKVLAACGLAGFEGRAVSELSGGELQRVALAGVLAMRPGYLALDEVTSQLDASARTDVRAIVRRAVSEGVGVLLVTHDVEEMATADRVALMADGRIAWAGTPGEFFGDAEVVRRAGLGRVPLGELFCRLARDGFLFGPSLDASRLIGAIEEDGLADEAREALGGGHLGEASEPIRGISSDTSALVARDVAVRYEGAAALDGVTVTAAPGRVLLVAGRSGSGKSTLAGVLAGVLETDAGEARLGNSPVRPGMVGLCQQRAENQLFCDTVLDDVAFGPRNLGATTDEADARAREALRSLGVDEVLWGRSPFALSGGQRRRVALAGVVAMRPGAYVLDEPTNGLDAEGRDQLHAVVRRLAEAGAAAVVISHDVGEWLRVVDDVVLLAAGRVAWQGTADELRSDVVPFAAACMRPPLEVAVLERLAGSALAPAASPEFLLARLVPNQVPNQASSRAPSQVPNDAIHPAALSQVSPAFGSKPAQNGQLTAKNGTNAREDGLGEATPAAANAAATPVPATATRVQRSPLLGSYHPADTPLHRLDARVKLACLLAVTVTLFAARGALALAAMAAAVLAAAHLGGLSTRELAQGLRPTAVILAFSLLANAFVADGTASLTLVGPLGISYPGLARGALAVGRIAVLVFAALVLSATTSSTAVADALTSLMAPLGRLGVPVGDIAMTVSIALRFIPLTAEELVRIRDAQRARGVDFAQGSVPARVRRWLSVLAPLVVALFRRADDLAQAMAERCYRGRGRTRLTRPMRPSDLLVLAAVAIGCLVCALL